MAFASAPAAPALVGGVPLLTAHMAARSAFEAVEVWRCDRPVRSGTAGAAVFAEDGEHLFYAVRLEPQSVYRDAVRKMYGDALSFAWDHGYRDLVRMWNLIGGITGLNADGVEVYRDFCVGRAEAFAAHRDRFPRLPAPTGIGSLSPGVDLCFLAAKPGRTVHLENPRQTPAYRYPVQYGPKPPSFARATFQGQGESGTLFVSGTASIVGDETVHRGDVGRQTVETLRNIDVLVGRENLRRHGLVGGHSVLDLTQVKIYVKNAEDMPVVREICDAVFPESSEVAYFDVGVCRPDLLVEIEGVCR